MTLRCPQTPTQYSHVLESQTQNQTQAKYKKIKPPLAFNLGFGHVFIFYWSENPEEYPPT